MIGGWVKQEGHHNFWVKIAYGATLPEPEGFRWPSPSAHTWYHMGKGYDCHANFYTPEQYMDSIHVTKWAPHLLKEVTPG